MAKHFLNDVLEKLKSVLLHFNLLQVISNKVKNIEEIS